MESNQNTESNPTAETPTPDTSAAKKLLEWNELGLSPEILETIAKAGLKHPTAVQSEAIPYAIARRDVIASAQTGTGKTASFVVPMVQNFKGREGTFGLILAPTREIAIQIHDTITLLGGPHGVRSIVLIGGVDYRKDAEGINSYPQIIVATPGRLCDHLDRGNIWLDFIQMVVLDEADRMLDMGFASQLARIMEEVPTERHTMLFSATIPPSVQKLATKILHDPARVAIGKPLSAAHSVVQRLLYMKEEAKNRELMRLLKQEPGSLIVFTRSKDGATRVWRSLHSAGIYDATYIHSDRLQKDRELALTEYKEGKYRVLIATDVAGRGIHINDVAHVVNYDLPMEPEDYIHRIGRTGRAGQTGKSTTFVTSRDRKSIAGIEKLVGKSIPAEYTSSWPKPSGDGPDPSAEVSADDRGGRGGRSGGRGGSSRGGREGSREASRPEPEAERGPPPKPSADASSAIRIAPRSVPLETDVGEAPAGSKSSLETVSSRPTREPREPREASSGSESDGPDAAGGEAKKRRRRRGGKRRGGDAELGASPATGSQTTADSQTEAPVAKRRDPAPKPHASTGIIRPNLPPSEPVRASSLRSTEALSGDEDTTEDPGRGRPSRGRKGSSGSGSSSDGSGTAFPV